MSRLCFSRLGALGRLGNQLFQVASTIGLAHSTGREPSLPFWKYAKYFQGKHPQGPQLGVQMREPHFHHSDFVPNDGRDYDLSEYLQSEKYWKEIEPEIRKHFKWEKEFFMAVRNKYLGVIKKKTIAISVRRGDYVGNPNYELLPAMYYILALYENFPDWRYHNLLFFSDDMDWCRLHFKCLPNAYFATDFDNKDYFFSETAIEQLCLGSMCDHFILSNSTFSWWMAYLANKGKVVRPTHYLAGDLKRKCNMKDFWPKDWIEFDHKGKKFDLKDVCFTIPVQYDHNDRKQNLDLSVCMLQRDFDCNITVGEINTSKFGYFQQWCRYKWFKMPFFHRTKVLNDLAMEAGTDIVCNFDADIFIPPMAMIMAVESLRAGQNDFVYPYNGKFARVDRHEWFKKLEKHLDVGIFAGKAFRGMNPEDAISVGGCVMYRKDVFLESGGENENFISHSPEDAERFYRWNTLGYKVGRIDAVLYHCDHWIGPDSSGRHQNAEAGMDEWRKVKEMDKKQLLAYISTWKWLK